MTSLFQETGFQSILEIDNTYEILVSDLKDLIDELNAEKTKIFGFQVNIRYNLS